jgi:hypothetical protein
MSTVKDVISRVKWIGIVIMTAAFPIYSFVDHNWGNLIMAFGLGVALSFGVSEVICWKYDDETNTGYELKKL